MKDSNYVLKKIAHMKRIGVGGGIGKNGGAAPDWLIQTQKAQSKSE